jgi:putative flippase GtrA
MRRPCARPCPDSLPRAISPFVRAFDAAQFFAFCCVGVLNTLLDFLAFLTLSLFLPLSAARVLSWAVACAFSYALNKRRVFRHTPGGRGTAARFVIVNLCGLSLGIGALELMTRFGWEKLIAYAATIPVITIGNYFGYKLWSFK